MTIIESLRGGTYTYIRLYPLSHPTLSPSLPSHCSISGPVPGIAPNINTTSGKFTMQTRQGELLSTDPKARHSSPKSSDRRGVCMFVRLIDG